MHATFVGWSEWSAFRDLRNITNGYSTITRNGREPSTSHELGHQDGTGRNTRACRSVLARERCDFPACVAFACARDGS